MTGPTTGRARKDPFIHTPVTVGKYLVSPLTRTADDGRYRAAVSIRSGTGSMTHDRVLCFDPLFATHEQATRFAARQAFAWIGRLARGMHPSPSIQE